MSAPLIYSLNVVGKVKGYDKGKHGGLIFNTVENPSEQIVFIGDELNSALARRLGFDFAAMQKVSDAEITL